MTRVGRPRDARVDEQIVVATLAEIEERGFAGASIESIAARVGVGKATIYRRWPNREALLRFVAEQVTDAVEVGDTGDLRKDLLAVFEPLAAQFYVGGAARLMPAMIAEAARDESMRELLHGLVQERRQPAVDAVERARSRGELKRGVVAEDVVDLIAGSFLYRFLLLGQPLGPDVARKAIDAVLDGVLS